jgi:hypothetical protein
LNGLIPRQAFASFFNRPRPRHIAGAFFDSQPNPFEVERANLLADKPTHGINAAALALML